MPSAADQLAETLEKMTKVMDQHLGMLLLLNDRVQALEVELARALQTKAGAPPYGTAESKN